MVSSRRDTSLQHLTDADLSACVDSFLVNVLPVFIEERQPVEQLGMFDLGHIPKQRLVEVMVGVDKTRHHQHARTRDGAVCRGIENWRPRANGRDDVVVDDNIITAIGTGAPVLDTPADRTISGTRMLMMPGFVNTHHHLYQTLFRNVPQVEHAKLFDWLKFLYEHWKYIDEEAVYTSAQVGICEMLKTGVTTTTDHLYLYPYGNNAIIDAEIRAARDVGVRFHPTRGSMSLSKKDGGLPPDSVVQTDEEILVESERVIHQYHDRGRYPMTRIALAPCSPFSVTTDLMKQTAVLAEREDVLIHTHLAETQD